MESVLPILAHTSDTNEDTPSSSTATPVSETDANDQPAASTHERGVMAEPARDAASIAFGDFQIIRKLGSGGCGVVYKARQISHERTVALKVLSRELAAKPAFVERFYREARAMAKLDHPNVVRCYEAGQKQGTHYLVVEYVNGGSARQWFEKLGRFSVGDALHIVIACAHALQHAHDRKLVHRDVKPDNVLLTRTGIVKLADLGLAKAWDEDLSVTMTGAGIGTPLYMAPEQARDAKNLDGRTDIYPLGVMLYHFLVGTPPFEGITALEIIEAKERGTHRPARKSNPDVPERLDLIMDKMMSRRLEHRYQSCSEVIRALEELQLANPQLSFLRALSRPASSAVLPAPPPLPVVVEPPKPAEPPEQWYLQHTTANGKAVTMRLSTAEVLDLIKTDKIKADAQVSRDRNGPFGALATHREFESVLQSKAMKARGGLQSRAAKLSRVYEMAERKEPAERGWNWLPRFGGEMPSWLRLLIWATIAAAVAVGLLHLVQTGFAWLRERGDL
jgi:serine/threonine-protein kinase